MRSWPGVDGGAVGAVDGGLSLPEGVEGDRMRLVLVLVLMGVIVDEHHADEVGIAVAEGVGDVVSDFDMVTGVLNQVVVEEGEWNTLLVRTVEEMVV